MAAELAASNLNADNHLLLDQSFLKTPLELGRKNHKVAQRNVERERDTLLTSLKTAAKDASAAIASDDASRPGTTATLSSLDGMITRMETLKRKLSALHAEENALHAQSRARVQHVQTLHAIPSVADVKYDEWSKVRLNRLMVDYLLRCGYEESAKSLAKANGIEPLVDIDEFVAARKIERSLEEGRTGECLAWCGDNRAALKKMGSDLEHSLRLQEYIELLRTRTSTTLHRARTHAQKHLTTHRQPDAIIRAAGLLAYPSTTPIEPYKSMYSSKQWTHLAALFRRTHHSLLGLAEQPPLYVALGAGLSALKTPSCHSSYVSPSSALNATSPNTSADATTTATTTNGESGTASAVTGTAGAAGAHARGDGAAAMNPSSAHGSHSVCPICSTELNELARPVPYAHHAKSVVDADLVVLPNGRVYGRQRLMAFQGKVGGASGAGGGPGGGEGEGDGDVGMLDVGSSSNGGIGDGDGEEDKWIRDPADMSVVFEKSALKRVYIS